MRVSRRVLGITVEASGIEKIAPGTPYVFMPNHGSFIDGPWSWCSSPASPRVILKQSVLRLPSPGWPCAMSASFPWTGRAPRAARRASPGRPRSCARAGIRTSSSGGDAEPRRPPGAVPQRRLLPALEKRRADRPRDDPGHARAHAKNNGMPGAGRSGSFFTIPSRSPDMRPKRWRSDGEGQVGHPGVEDRGPGPEKPATTARVEAGGDRERKG